MRRLISDYLWLHSDMTETPTDWKHLLKDATINYTTKGHQKQVVRITLTWPFNWSNLKQTVTVLQIQQIELRITTLLKSWSSCTYELLAIGVQITGVWVFFLITIKGLKLFVGKTKWKSQLHRHKVVIFLPAILISFWWTLALLPQVF